MVQESTMICIDNSGWMRNGDFTPTRMQCQQDAANLIVQCKLRANPENAVGILSMADTVEVLSTLTQENGKLFMKLHQVEPKGESNFINGIKVAHLALKHRQNRNHKMRIVLFVGSPIEHLDSTELTRLAKKLKKEKVQVDVVCFGEADSVNSEVMGQFVECLNGRDGNGSNLVVVSAGSTLTEALVSSQICRGENGAAAPVVPAGGGGFEFVIDPEDDPDLALALRVSLEEQRQRQQQEAIASVDGVHQPMETNERDIMSMDPGAMTEEEQLEWALRMSMQEDNVQSDNANTETSMEPMDTSSTCTAWQPTPVRSDVSVVDEDLALLSRRSDGPDSSTGPDDDQLGQLMSDPELLRRLVAGLPGVDLNSQEIRDAVNNVAGAGNTTGTGNAEKNEKNQKDQSKQDGRPSQ